MATRRLRIRYEASFNLFQQLNSLLYPVSFITDAETHTIKVRQVRTQETIQTLHTLQSFASVYGEIYRDLLKAVSPVIRPYSDNRESQRGFGIRLTPLGHQGLCVFAVALTVTSPILGGLTSLQSGKIGAKNDDI